MPPGVAASRVAKDYCSPSRSASPIRFGVREKLRRSGKVQVVAHNSEFPTRGVLPGEQPALWASHSLLIEGDPAPNLKETSMTIAIKLSALALLAAGINGAVLTEASAGSVTPPVLHHIHDPSWNENPTPGINQQGVGFGNGGGVNGGGFSNGGGGGGSIVTCMGARDCGPLSED